MSAVIASGRLDAERLRRIVESRTVADAFKALGDYGYVYSEGQTVDGFIVGETNRLIEFIAENSPSESFKNALTARFKYNNAKLAYKSRFGPVPDDGYYSVDFDAQKIAEGDYSDADKYMEQALYTLDENKSSHPQEIDLALTRAMYAYILSCGGPPVKNYFRAEIDMKNILTAARMKKLNLAGDQFISGGKVSIERLNEALEGDDFASCFEGTKFEELSERIAQNELKDLWQAELMSDDYLYYLTYKDVTSYTSLTPLLNYYTETLIELKTLKTALVCVKTDSRDLFFKRLPEIYKM